MVYSATETRKFLPPIFGQTETPPIVHKDELVSLVAFGALAASFFGPSASIIKAVIGTNGLYAVNVALTLTALASIPFKRFAESFTPSYPSHPTISRDPEEERLDDLIKLARENKYKNKLSDPLLQETKAKNLTAEKSVTFSPDCISPDKTELARPPYADPTPSGWILTRRQKRLLGHIKPS